MVTERDVANALLIGARVFEQRINRIAFLCENDCDVTWDVYLETLFPALGEALLVFLIPSPGEVLENYLEPKPGRKGSRRGNRQDPRRRRGRNGQPRRRFRNPIPDVDELVAGTIFGRRFFAGRNAGPLESLLWTGINRADLLAFWWMVIVVADDFVYNWSSAILESKFCQAEFEVVGSAELPIEIQSNRRFYQDPDELTVNTARKVVFFSNSTLLFEDEQGSDISVSGTVSASTEIRFPVNSFDTGARTIQTFIQFTDQRDGAIVKKLGQQYTLTMGSQITIGVTESFEFAESVVLFWEEESETAGNAPTFISGSQIFVSGESVTP